MSHLLMLAALFADAKTSGGGGSFLAWVLLTIGMWTVFTKAGRPGWPAIIPVYNLYILFKIAGWSGISMLLLLVPVVNVVVLFLVTLNVAQKFGKGFLFTLGLTFLPFIFYPILGLGSSTYAAYR